MKNEQKFGCWQVSVSEDDGRKYYHFSSLGRALWFVDDSIQKYIKKTGYYPVRSVNVSYRVFPMGVKPARLDGKRFKEANGGA